MEAQMNPALRETVIGIELGSTRIKAALLDRRHRVIAESSVSWESRLVGGLWTYSYEEIRSGLRRCFAGLAARTERVLGVPLSTAGAIGISGMMHGYLPLSAAGEPLANFRTWQNTNTAEAASALSALFDMHIPQRWSAAHLYQAILNGERHVPDIRRITTLAGYVHGLLTGEQVVGLGEASGMFPLDGGGYDRRLLRLFDERCRPADCPWQLEDILPTPLPAGAFAGNLTPAGAALLDPSGVLRPGMPFAPPEGDAGTGMAATNSVRAGTGNVSAGTSVFAMVVTERSLRRCGGVDPVATPDGKSVAMVHCNNCTGDLNAWAGLFSEAVGSFAPAPEPEALYDTLFRAAAEGDADCGGLLSVNYLAGEELAGLARGRPIFTRAPDARLTLANFMRAQLASALCTLALGLRDLAAGGVKIKRLTAHGGFFKTPGVGQRMLSAAAGGTPVTVADTAGEGGAYGMALLCAYMLWRRGGEPLEDYLDRAFDGAPGTTLSASDAETQGFASYAARFEAALELEHAAVRLPQDE